MTGNPFASPPAESSSAGESPQQPRPRRPIGIWILSVLQFLNGVPLFFAAIRMLANGETMADPMALLGAPPALMIAGVMLLALVAVCSGLGMLVGAKSGWWLGAFYYLYGVFRNGSVVVIVLILNGGLENADEDAITAFVEFGGRAGFHVLLFFYFFKANVLGYFRLEALSKVKAVGLLAAICLAITVGVTMVGFL